MATAFPEKFSLMTMSPRNFGVGAGVPARLTAGRDARATMIFPRV